MSSKEGVYVFYGDRCERLNPSTGKTDLAFSVGPVDGLDEDISWGNARIHKEFLIAAVAPYIPDAKVSPGTGTDIWSGVSSSTR